MAALPQHNLYYVIGGGPINGPRQIGEVLDVEELGIQQSISVLVGAGYIAAVPYGSKFSKCKGITFVNDEFAAEYKEYSKDVVEEEDNSASDDDSTEDGADVGDVVEEESESLEDTLTRLGNLNKADLTAAATELGVAPDESLTKAEIVGLVEAHLDSEGKLKELGRLNRDDLIAEAEALGVEVEDGETKAEIMSKVEDIIV